MRAVRSFRWRYAESHRSSQQKHVPDRDTVAHGDRGADVIGDRADVELVATRRPLGDDDQLLGTVVGVALQGGVGVFEHLVGKLVGGTEGGDVSGARAFEDSCAEYSRSCG